MIVKTQLIKNYMFIFLACATLFNTINAQTSIPFGSNLTGEINTPGEIDTFTFTASANDIIYIRMIDVTDVDSHIKLYNPGGTYITDAKSDGGLAEIREFTLTESGTYTLIAYDENHNDVGAYGLSLHKLNQPNYATPLSAFSSQVGEITSLAAINTYSFNGESGDVISSELRSYTTAFEGKMYLYDPSGLRLITSTKVGRRQVIEHTLEETGSYTIVILDKGGNDTDSYGFNFAILNKHSEATPLECSNGFTSSFTHPVDKEFYRLDSGDGILHLLESRSNDTGLELTMEIFNDQGAQVHKVRKNNKVIQRLLSGDESSSYLVALYDQSGNDYGDFGFQVHTFDAECQSTISCGAFESTFDLNTIAASKAFFLEGTEGESAQIEITRNSGDLDPQLRIFDLDGNLLYKKVGPARTSTKNYIFPSTDTYILIAGDLNVNETGNVTVTSEMDADVDISLADCFHAYHGMTGYNTTTLSMDGNLFGLDIEWSTGETTSTIDVSPTESQEYSVTVTTNEGCTKELSTYVDVQDISCNDGELVKVKICQVSVLGEEEQLCLTENEAILHLVNPLNIFSYVGECAYVYTCGDDNSGLTTTVEVNKVIDAEENIIEIREANLETNSSKVFPNPTNGLFQVATENGEKITELKIQDVTGMIIHRMDSDLNSNVNLDMNQFHIPSGVYYISVKSENSTKMHKLIFVR